MSDRKPCPSNRWQDEGWCDNCHLAATALFGDRRGETGEALMEFYPCTWGDPPTTRPEQRFTFSGGRLHPPKEATS